MVDSGFHFQVENRKKPNGYALTSRETYGFRTF